MPAVAGGGVDAERSQAVSASIKYDQQDQPDSFKYHNSLLLELFKK